MLALERRAMDSHALVSDIANSVNALLTDDWSRLVRERMEK
jgi:hypothetical protein